MTALIGTTGSSPALPRMLKVSRGQLASVVAGGPEAVDPRQRDEMAIPSYLHWNPLIRWLMWQRYDAILRLGEFATEHVVLEFGCGTGVFLPTLAAYAGSVAACDLFPQYAKRLSEVLELEVDFVDSMASLDDGSFDRIVSADVLEHVPEPHEQLRQFAKLLKPDGRLLVSGPTESRVYHAGRIAAGFAGKGDYHKRDIGDIRRLAESIGYRTFGVASLPFRTPPHLFRVYDFRFQPMGVTA